jgi:DNA polymerase (family X)
VAGGAAAVQEVNVTVPNPANRDIADALARIAALLDAQEADPYRVAAYRRGARRIDQLPTAAAAWVRSDDQRLETLPDVGPRIAGLIREFVHTGRMALLERLEGAIEPEDLFRTVPGIGPELAARIHAHLEIESLEELEMTAHSGALETVPGIGPRRAAGIAHAVGDILNRAGRRRHLQRGRTGAPGESLAPEEAPPVALLLAIDARYRRRAAAGRLKTIVPRRFNPEGRAWLPILHAEKDPWHFTALYSNTARAHELGRTRDWVVIYYDRDGLEDRSTVVTERRGPDRGRRVVRGREEACRTYHRHAQTAAER